MEPMQVNEWMSVKDVAGFLGVSTATVMFYAKTGGIPAAKIGRQWRFNRADLLDHIRKQYKEKDALSTDIV